MSDAELQDFSAPYLQRTKIGGMQRCELGGAWNLHGLEPRLSELQPQLAECALDQRCEWDLRHVQMLDHAGAMLLWRVWGKHRVAQLLLRPEHEQIFDRFDLPPEPVPLHRPHDPFYGVVVLGQGVLSLVDHLLAVVMVLGQVVLDTLDLLRRPANIPWREISASIYRTGAQALGITALVGFLVGVVLSYLSAQQLKLFGADAFIINILGISVIRELGPVLAAILVAGRSGSAITAQLGVMRVTEELDAMAVMGIPHTLRLVMPKMFALALSMPLIILWTDGVALIGGMVSAHAQLDIGYVYFLSSLPDAVPIANLWLGLGKGIVFGSLIALIGCHFGLRIEPNTESLGIGTTNSVVTSITVVIIVDAIFAILFKDVGVG
ncbi:MAG TPA: ABC transporter permease [Burkholderiales bacterium]|nr:ABC transporter permease [Burkholderiales bacterium]